MLEDFALKHALEHEWEYLTLFKCSIEKNSSIRELFCVGAYQQLWFWADVSVAHHGSELSVDVKLLLQAGADQLIMTTERLCQRVMK